MKVSIIITAFKEPKTIYKAIFEIAKQVPKTYEILIVAPDDETLNEAGKVKTVYKNLKIIKDKGEGKSAALNLAKSKSKGDVLILTDGDVYLGKEAVENLLAYLKDKKVGAVSGNPVSIHSRKNKFGYWAYLLTEIANERRKRAISTGKRFFCSGYLFAIRKHLLPLLPKNLLSEDGFISHYVYSKNFRIEYSENSKVYVKYPDNFSDWVKQKKRSAGGYNQIKKMLGIEMRSFRKESRGLFGFFKYVRNFMEALWLAELFLARIYLWALIYRDVNLKKKSTKELWVRVESTK